MRHLLIVLLTVVIWCPDVVAQWIAPGGTIPAVANIHGKYGTFWRSDVNILNVNAFDTSVVLLLLPEIVGGVPEFEPKVSDEIHIPAGAQVTLANVVQTEFGEVDTKGGLTVFSLDGAPLVISSRTYTVAADGGSFGQDVIGLLTANTGWATGLRNDSLYRTNVGVFLPLDPNPGETVIFTVTVFSSDGTEKGSGSIFFEVGGLQQKPLDVFGVGTLLDGYAVVTCSDPSAIWFGYASIVDKETNDGVYRAVVGKESDLP